MLRRMITEIRYTLYGFLTVQWMHVVRRLLYTLYVSIILETAGEREKDRGETTAVTMALV
jgi:hypothetical protein